MKKWFIVALVLWCTLPLFATWSIVAFDPVSGEVGSAGASWSPGVWAIVGLAPGKGVIVAQADTNQNARKTGVAMLIAGKSPQEILKTITSREFDRKADRQQYGIVALGAGAQAWTGASCERWASNLQDDGVAVQGNFLANDTVVPKTLAAYKAAKGLPLAERLLQALEAGSKAGGDGRAGFPTAMTAYLLVSKPGDAPDSASFGLIVPPPANSANPVSILRERYESAKGQTAIVRLPDMDLVWILGLFVPMVAGFLWALTIFILRARGSSRPVWLLLLVSLLVPVFSFLAAVEGARFLGWALPIYGEVVWILIAITAVASLIFSAFGFAFAFGAKLMGQMQNRQNGTN